MRGTAVVLALGAGAVTNLFKPEVAEAHDVLPGGVATIQPNPVAAVASIPVHVARYNSAEPYSRRHNKDMYPGAIAPTSFGVTNGSLPTTTPTERDVAIVFQDAEQYWGATVCENNITFEFSDIDPQASAFALWDNYGDGAGYINGDAHNVESAQVSAQNFTNCIIGFNSVRYGSLGQIVHNWTQICTDGVREVMHLDNQYATEPPEDHGTDTTNPETSIAYAGWTGENTPPQCMTTAPQGALLITRTPNTDNWFMQKYPSGKTIALGTLPDGEYFEGVAQTDQVFPQ
jgi:hypothetical protein